MVVWGFPTLEPNGPPSATSQAKAKGNSPWASACGLPSARSIWTLDRVFRSRVLLFVSFKPHPSWVQDKYNKRYSINSLDGVFEELVFIEPQHWFIIYRNASEDLDHLIMISGVFCYLVSSFLLLDVLSSGNWTQKGMFCMVQLLEFERFCGVCGLRGRVFREGKRCKEDQKTPKKLHVQ